MTVTYVQISMYCCLLIIPFILRRNFWFGNHAVPICCWFLFLVLFIFIVVCGVWVQDNQGWYERYGCMVAEVFGEQYNSADKLNLQKACSSDLEIICAESVSRGSLLKWVRPLAPDLSQELKLTNASSRALTCHACWLAGCATVDIKTPHCCMSCYLPMLLVSVNHLGARRDAFMWLKS